MIKYCYIDISSKIHHKTSFLYQPDSAQYSCYTNPNRSQGFLILTHQEVPLFYICSSCFNSIFIPENNYAILTHYDQLIHLDIIKIRKLIDELESHYLILLETKILSGVYTNYDIQMRLYLESELDRLYDRLIELE